MDDLGGYFAHPVRLGVLAVLLFQTAFNIYRRMTLTRYNAYRLEHIGVYRVQLMAVESVFLIGAFCDRRGLGVMPEPVRWWGLGLLILGTLLMAWAILRTPGLFDPAILAEDSHGIPLAHGASVPPGAEPSPPSRRLSGEDFRQGPYRWLRYPTSFGQIVLLLGLALCFRSWTCVAFAGMLLAATFFRTRETDAAYQRFYGRAWAEYSEMTRRFLPFVY